VDVTKEDDAARWKRAEDAEGRVAAAWSAAELG
jgi:hypothetical protein